MMKVLAVFLTVVFALVGVPAFASAASANSFHPAVSSEGSICRPRKKKAKKESADSKGKKKGKDEKKAYGFEL
jgi:hypothetical protein